MDAPTHDLKGLFEQLGLDAEPADIDEFIASHPLSENQKLVEASFWSASQAKFLKDELLMDADWARVIDELNLRLHQGR